MKRLDTTTPLPDNSDQSAASPSLTRVGKPPRPAHSTKMRPGGVLLSTMTRPTGTRPEDIKSSASGNTTHELPQKDDARLLKGRSRFLRRYMQRKRP